jgi:N6-L-threonylcarbamoyladenine synthase
MLVLGIESSCDETAAAVLADGERLLSDVVNSQVQVHRRYGGVVPELASRKHLESIYPLVTETLRQAGVGLGDLDGLAVTQGPGLVGSLLVGFCFAKALALVKDIPCTGVDHMAGHLLSVFLGAHRPDFPYVALIASGGHSSIFRVEDSLTFRLLGRTRDDAAGEAFDKVAKLLQLPYPGGPEIGRRAEEGNPKAIDFPRAWLEPGSLDFSFSGIKTAVATFVQHCEQRGKPLHIADLCASFQEAVIEILAEKTLKAAAESGCSRVVLAGGVAANRRLREYITERGGEDGFEVFLPPIEFCTDNGAMIALAGYHRLRQGRTIGCDADVYSRFQLG